MTISYLLHELDRVGKDVGVAIVDPILKRPTANCDA